jgi:hypothetical protein
MAVGPADGELRSARRVFPTGLREHAQRVAVEMQAGEPSKERRNVPLTEQQGCAPSLGSGGHDVENDKGHHYLVARRRSLRTWFHSRVAK